MSKEKSFNLEGLSTLLVEVVRLMYNPDPVSSVREQNVADKFKEIILGEEITVALSQKIDDENYEAVIQCFENFKGEFKKMGENLSPSKKRPTPKG